MVPEDTKTVNDTDIWEMGLAEGYTTGQMFPWLDPYERVEAATVKDFWKQYQSTYEQGWLHGFALAIKCNYAEANKFPIPY